MSDKRVFSRVVCRCLDCPNKKIDDGDGESPWTGNYCLDTNPRRDILDISIIPVWCPLSKE